MIIITVPGQFQSRYTGPRTIAGFATILSGKRVLTNGDPTIQYSTTLSCYITFHFGDVLCVE